MAKGRLSNRSIEAFSCPPGRKQDFLWDDKLTGYGVCSRPSGKKTFVVSTRRAGRIAIGRYGPLNEKMAREEAKRVLGALASGRDLIAERRKERSGRTFEVVASDFLRDTQAKQKHRTFENYELALKVHAIPILGNRKLADVTRSDVAAIHRSMSARPYAANALLRVISAMWSWAVEEGEVERPSPCSGITRYAEHHRERFLTHGEFSRLGDALRETCIDPFAAAAIRLLLLTGARLREILHAEWSQVDFGRRVLFLADSKTGRKPIYLSAGALEVLSSLPRVEGNPYIIPGGKAGQPRSDLERPWGAVRKAAKLEDVRIHDLRHSFTSIGAGASMGLPIIGKLLGHTLASTTARYAHLDDDPMRRAVETIGATIDAAMDAGRGAEVVKIRKV
jgi:integrase